jgi:hypothetical protein
LAKPYLLGPLLIIFGALVLLFGRQFFAYTIALIGAVFGYVVVVVLFNVIVMLNGINTTDEGVTDTIDSDSWYFLIGTKVIAIIIGLFLGFILTKMLELGAAIIGGIIG